MMKSRSVIRKTALLLAVCLCLSTAVPVEAQAAAFRSSITKRQALLPGLRDWLKKWFDLEPETPEEQTPETPELTLVEDASTVAEGTALRAATYAAGIAETGTDNIKYFPVTLFNYSAGSGDGSGKEAGYNLVMHQYEVDHAQGALTKWNGMYFSSGTPGAAAYTYDDPTASVQSYSSRTYAQVQAGTYYADSACTNRVRVAETQSSAYERQANAKCNDLISSNSSTWVKCGGYFYTPDNGANYYPVYAKMSTSGSWYSGYTYTYTWGYSTTDSSGNVTQIGNTQQTTSTGTTASVNVYTYNTVTTYTLYNSSNQQLASSTNQSDSVGVTLYNRPKNTASLQYANHNKWTGKIGVPTGSGLTTSGNHVYSGLVESSLTPNKEIVFTVPDAGLFTLDEIAGSKEVYTRVGLPFQYDTAAKKYTFDANTMGAYFTDGADSNKNLTYSATPQINTDVNVQDGRKNGWYPFNGSATVTTSTADYYFGMIATIPFTMTADGKLSSAAGAPDITFNFSGDDDVWVFIDGKLVLDLGGIHNGVNGSLNFAANTWSITRMVTTVDGETGDVSGNNSPMSGIIFAPTESSRDAVPVINETRESFAARENHEMTVFYLERGAGSSNCKIEFNLPMKDSVTVTKTVNENDSAGQSLAAETLAQINNMDFGFRLYKDGAACANYRYSLLSASGQYLQTASTDASGHFTLRNGQTAKFIGQIDSTNGNSYYVVEDALAAGVWETPVSTFTATAAGGYLSTPAQPTGYTSQTVTATGSDEAEDKVAFTFTNTMTHVVNTALTANDDIIVIDYGLPVEIDVLKNDIAIAGAKSISRIITEALQFGTCSIEGNKLLYTLTAPLDDVEVIEYEVLLTATSGVEGDNKTATAKVYIVPATTMYYEEDFGSMVTYTSGWESQGTATNSLQEPGVAGTVDDSPYGSDIAYLDDNADSNGTCKHVDTTEGAAAFRYTFTGTGTSFYARTTNTSGYMRVVISKPDGSKETLFRDTRFISEPSETLYNIPVFSWHTETRDTYTVTVTVMKPGSLQVGNDFWLDGIRVYNPMNEQSQYFAKAQAAYSLDGESNMQHRTAREHIISEYADESTGNWTGTPENVGFILLTDVNGEMQLASQYISDGPKEEVYLYNGQSISFALRNWDPNANKYYIGLKAPKGSGTVIINNQAITLSNTTDCFFEISQYMTISGTEGNWLATVKIVSAPGSLISVTTMKATGTVEYTWPQDDITVVSPDGGGE